MMFGISPDEPDLVHALHLPIGERVTVRPARPQDSGMIQAYIRSLSPASRRNRFLGALNEVSANELYGMTHTDRCSHPALIAENVVEGARPDGLETHKLGEVWGGAFWELRKKFGRDKIDRLLFDAWKRLQPVAGKLEKPQFFVDTIVGASKAAGNEQDAKIIRQAFERRKLN